MTTPKKSSYTYSPPDKECLFAVYSAFYHAPIPIFIIDRQGKILDANPVFVARYTQRYPRCIGANLYEDAAALSYAPPFTSQRIATLENVFSTGQFATVQDIVAGRCLLSGIYPVFSGEGEVEKCFIVTEDITAQNELEQSFREQQSQLDITSRSCRLGLWKLDLKTMSIVANAEHDRIFGVEPSTVKWTPRNFTSFVVEEDRQEVKAIVRKSLEKRTDETIECRIRRPDGMIRWISVLGKHQFDQDGQPVCVIGVTQDITEQKELAIRHDELQEQLLQSQKMELIGQLAGGIAHDFNNILAAIQGNADLVLHKTSPTSPHYQNLVSIITSVKRSAEMVKQLLAFARKQPISPRKIELDAELEKMRLLIRKLIRENIALNWTLNCPGAYVNLDPANLVQIITNIVVNARDAIESNGAITFTTRITDANSCDELKEIVPAASGKYAGISVSDSGSGIEPRVLSHIYEPFFTTKGVGKGTGLGLSTVYGLVRQNHGYITCRSDIDKGTTFEIFFPLVTDMAEGVGRPTPKSRSEKPCEAIILVIDDEPEIREIIKIFLESEGFNVLLAKSAEEGIKIVDSIPDISLVITDIILPEMNGVQMSKQMLKIMPDLKFLFMSGYSADSLRRYGKMNEESNFISKPFKLDHLLKMVQQLLEKGEPGKLMDS